MIFRNLLDDKTKLLQQEFDRLLIEISTNQTHQGDLLLVIVNGFFDAESTKWHEKENKLPYVFGPNSEGHSENLHYNFIGRYITSSVSDQHHLEYLDRHIWSPQRQKEISELIEMESYSIQMEMLIYLKIWEADLFIKKMYQLTRLLEGKPYDWHFNLPTGNRDKRKNTGKKEEIIVDIVAKVLKDRYPIIFEAIEKSYKSQIRNSIAHSKYSFLGRYIHLNNYIESDPYSQLHVVSFDEWIDIMHKTLVIYTQFNRLLNKAEDAYRLLSLDNDQLIEVRINFIHPEPGERFEMLKHRGSVDAWMWAQNDNQ